MTVDGQYSIDSRTSLVGRSAEDAASLILDRLRSDRPVDATRPPSATRRVAERPTVRVSAYAGGMKILGERNAPVLDAIAWCGGNSGVGFELSDCCRLEAMGYRPPLAVQPTRQDFAASSMRRESTGRCALTWVCAALGRKLDLIRIRTSLTAPDWRGR
jgi:hypothetical protein